MVGVLKMYFDGCEAAKPKPSKMKRLYLLVPDSKLLFEPDNNDSVSKMKQPKVTS